jgi:hypothetical protein
MADPKAPDATPQADTGPGADNRSQGAPQDGTTPATGDTPNPNHQDQAGTGKPEGGNPPEGGDKGGDPIAKPGDGKDGQKGEGDKPEGPRADVKSAAEYGLEGEDNLTKWFADEAFKHGLTKSQALALKVGWDGLREQAETHARNEAAKAVVLLQKAWGDSYDTNMAAANKAISTFGSPELVAELERTGFGRNPHMVKFVHNLAKLLSEDSFITGATGGGGTNTSAADVLYPNQK